jgi:hypothetical protein
MKTGDARFRNMDGVIGVAADAIDAGLQLDLPTALAP